MSENPFFGFSFIDSRGIFLLIWLIISQSATGILLVYSSGMCASVNDVNSVVDLRMLNHSCWNFVDYHF